MNEINNLKTLVIHPSDPTTDMLKVAYEGMECTIINDNRVSRSKLRKSIKEHDRIIMLGHGTKEGLIGDLGKRLLINSQMVEFLRPKECIVVWCYANSFLNRYRIENCPLNTGMIISEFEEAYYLGINKFTMEDIDESNIKFGLFLKEFIQNGNFNLELYKSDTNPIIQFNRQNIKKYTIWGNPNEKINCLQFKPIYLYVI